MRRRGIITLVLTVLLCTPSLLAALTVFINGMMGRGMVDWGRFSAVVVSSGVFLGGPLVLAGSVVSAFAGLRNDVSKRMKYVHYAIVCVAMMATFALTFHFGM